MSGRWPDLRLWLIGLAMFGGLIALSSVGGDASPFNIVDHQAAGSAAVVNTIQADWQANGMRNLMIGAMIADLVFIGFFGIGSIVAGRSIAEIAGRTGSGVVRIIGLSVAVGGAVFLVTDYLETVLQLIQMLRNQGSDWMASTAAFAQKIKIPAWIVCFTGVIAAAVIIRLGRASA